MNDNRINVTRSSMPPMEEYVAEIAPLWESRWLTNMGAKHRELEAALKARLKVPGIELFANGHLALECAIEALRLGEDGRRKVITTPFTFASTTHAIMRKGLVPVFADVRAGDYTIDPDSVEQLVDDETCAILPVHVYGNLCDVDAIQAIADRHGLKVLYDAAHAFGVERLMLDGTWRGAASFGDASMLSFHATKVFNTVEGGAVCFADPEVGERLRLERNYGLSGEDSVLFGGNAKMSELHAAMGLCNLRHLDGEIERRRTTAERYWDNLRGVPGIKLCEPPSGVKHNYAYLSVVFEDDFGATRDDVFDSLAAERIGARKYFYPLTGDFACCRGRLECETPVARGLSSRVLTLPLYADLALKDVDRICEIAKGCAR